MNSAPDSIALASLIKAFRSREQVGIAKYGVTVDRTDLDHVQWLQHALEEDMDRCLYMQRAIDTAMALIKERDRLRAALQTIVENRHTSTDMHSYANFVEKLAREALVESIA